MKNLVLIGGGNHAHYTIDIIEKQGEHMIVGIIDSLLPLHLERFGYKVIGRQENIRELIKLFNIHEAIISVGDNWSRHVIYQEISHIAPDLKFSNAIHPSVIIGNNVSMGNGIIAMAGCIFNPKSSIGNFSFFATGAQVEHDCCIGEFASISAGSIMGGHVVIGRYAAIALGSTVIDRVTIGENTLVGSGSLVTKSLPSNVLAYGCPARIIRSRAVGEKFLK